MTIPDRTRALLSLPPRMGGLGIRNPIETATEEHEYSLHVTAPLKRQILNQDQIINDETLSQMSEHRSEVTNYRRVKNETRINELKVAMSETELRNLHYISEKGASCWLTALPLEEENSFYEKRIP